jgi:hypothetical protein
MRGLGNWCEDSIFSFVKTWARAVIAVVGDIRSQASKQTPPMYSPHLRAIVVPIGPARIELRASPSFRERCVRNSTELSHAELVFKPVQITKTFNVSVTYAQGLLERYCDDVVRGAIKMNVWTSSLLYSEPVLLSTLKNCCHLCLISSGHSH